MKVNFADNLLNRGLAELRDVDSTIPLHFNARKSQLPKGYSFEIVSKLSGRDKECHGLIDFEARSLSLETHGQGIVHDPDLLGITAKLGWNVPTILKDVKISAHEAIGRFEISESLWAITSHGVEVIHATILLSLFSTCRHHLPAKYKVISIDQISLQYHANNLEDGTFYVTVREQYLSGCLSDILISSGAATLVLQGIHLGIDELADTKLPLGALFNCPVTKPDISYMKNLGTCLSRMFFQLVTHKWPMADIGIAGFSDPEPILDSISSALNPTRHPFRSIQVQCSSPMSWKRTKIYTVNEFATDCPLSLLVVGNESPIDPTKALSHLNPDGILCISAGKHLESKLHGLHHKGTLQLPMMDVLDVYGPSQNERSDTVLENTVIFADCCKALPLGPTFTPAESVPLETSAIQRFCDINLSTKYEAVIIESAEQSMINSWRGETLLPWLRHLMWTSSSIIWVSQITPPNPFHGFAGILLRTLQAEKPSLKVAWIVTDKCDDTEKLSKKILHARNMICGNGNELKITWIDECPQITRYVPEDELSTMIGLSPPMILAKPIGEYDLTLASKENVVLSTTDCSVSRSQGVHIVINASVIDFHDLLRFQGVLQPAHNQKMGLFFAGSVEDDTLTQSDVGSQVVGWQRGAHSRKLMVEEDHLYPCKDGVDASSAVVEFAALAISYAALDGVARAREGDFVRSSIGGILGETLRRTITKLGASIFEDGSSRNVHFDLKICELGGLLVNDIALKQIDIETYLTSKRGKETLRRALITNFSSHEPVKSFPITQLDQAFKVPIHEAYGVVITHCQPQEPIKQLVKYHKIDSLFSPNGIYIIVGGLGGLGRFVCSWMVQQGARNLVIMSRNGINSPEAKTVVEEIRSSACVEVMKVNACDKDAVAIAFADVRTKGRIRGVLNMAMILADAPMASMTGEEWDTALRLKVDSSWNLHQETLTDDLDLFILFSSIASVLGNRNQGNYNVGNAFLNALAEYRHTLDLPAVSIGLGAMSKSTTFPLSRTPMNNILKHLFQLILEFYMNWGTPTFSPTYQELSSPL